MSVIRTLCLPEFRTIIKISIELIFSAIKNTLLMSKEESSHFMKTDQCDYFSFPIIGTCIQILDNHFENLNCIHASINYPQLRDYFFVSRKYFLMNVLYLILIKKMRRYILRMVFSFLCILMQLED